MSEVILAVEDLTVSFDGFRAVDGLNFYVEKDELRCVIGPNGAGKTTLLDMICGKTKPSHGRIHFKRYNLVDMIEYQITRIGVGRKFQTPSVYEDLTVFENLEISYPKKRGILGSLFFRRDQDLLGKIDQVAEQIFLHEVLRHKAGRLSHGQKQWLEIGMLLMQDPELLLLDEPVAGHEREGARADRRAAERHLQGPLDRGDRARHGVRAPDRAQGHRPAPGQAARRGQHGPGAERRAGQGCVSGTLR